MRGKYEIFISAPDDTFLDKSLGVHEDYDSAIEDARHYFEMGMRVKVLDQRRKRFINLEN